MGLDGVELVMAWEESFGITITDADAAQLRTPRMATDLIHRKLATAGVPGPGGCLTQRAFHRLQRAVQAAFAVPRQQVRPQTPLDALLPAGKRRAHWQALQAQTGLVSFPKLFFGRLPFGCGTVGEFAVHLAARQPVSFRQSDAPWTRAQVRSLVRLLIVEQLGIKEFHDDDDFVRDLRVD